MSSQSLQDRWIVVTGGANGMGKASCLRLAQSGASLAICDLNKSAGDALVEQLTKEYPSQQFLFTPVDVTDESAVDEFQFLAVGFMNRV